MTTLGQLVTMVRAEAGHSLSVSQGLNSLDTLKYLIQRTEKELYHEHVWPELVMRADTTLNSGQYEYAFPGGMGFDQVREAFWSDSASNEWQPVAYGIPEECRAPGGGNSTTDVNVRLWDLGSNETLFRVWPTPGVASTLRFKGMKPLNNLVADSDVCTLDGTLLVLRVSAELLMRAKAADADMKQQRAQRYLQKLLAGKVSAKNKTSTFGTSRGYRPLPRPGIDYIP